jgi:hypothetical protein
VTISNSPGDIANPCADAHCACMSHGITRQVNQFPVDAAWEPLEDGKDYKMAILDFILAGGDGYGMVPAGVR